MTSQFAKQFSRSAAPSLMRCFGQLVTYTRNGESIAIKAILAGSQFESVLTTSQPLEYRRQDFIVRQKDLDFGSGPTKPRRKDSISLFVDGAERVFEVLPEPSLEHYEVTGVNDVSYRIYTKEKPS